MSKLNILVFCIFGLISVCVGQNDPIELEGQCDSNINVVTNFNLNSYLGEWRLIESYPSNFQSGTCNTAVYSAGDNGSVTVFNTQVVNQQLSSSTGSAVLATTDGRGILSVTFPNNPTPIELRVLATDYTSYSLAYACVNLENNRKRLWGWKLSRTNTLTATAVTAINQIVSSTANDLSAANFYVVDRSDAGCFYYPTPISGTDVIFPGQCDPNITVVTNFNATAYLGEWRLIESYYSRFQTGTCNKAHYSAADDGSVIVHNTQVVNQELASITGSAVPATNDGRGILTVTFPNIPGSDDLWILATDYTSYALLYTCVNVDSETRRVVSWKMSRTNTLTAAATTSINQVVNSIDVLDARYFETVDRSDAACFYLPTPVPGTDVIFPGQCDPNVPVVTNFNATAYLGEWRLIESYYTRFQSGTCNKANYSDAGDGSLIVHNTHVVNQELASITGSGVLANDSRGILTVSFPNIPDSQELWILATDYTTYSILYSCVNLDSESRRVWSWKMSRTNTLTATATTSINQVVNSIDVLDARYFETVDRSDAACFYLPTPVPGTDVIFPGQCDPNVPVVANFNATAYLGEWRLIESYYTRFQSGTCNKANYSDAGDGSLIVHNTHVVNQELASITGSGVLANDSRGILTVSFPNIPDSQELWILATDYTTYSILYSCVNLDSESRRVWSWKMSRTNTLTAAATTSINQVVNSIDVLDARYFETVDRSDAACFYLPTPVPGTDVIFPGQCDPNVPVVANFNATAYLGEWRLIESYYTRFQSGTCNKANYSDAEDGSLIVHNTHVVNQELASITGSGVLANDSRGILTVSFPNIPDSQELWILATDYTTYSLLYSCVNLDSERRRVWSWKMSRTNTLTAAATTSINQVVNSIDVLDARYFETVDRSDAACFYLPTPVPGTDVIFPGQCDPNVPVVANFNTTAYLGEWRLIESYYTRFQSGTCNKANYSDAEDGSLIVHNTHVVNQELASITGSGVLANDSRGILTVSFPNIPDSQELWILATDYTTYSLLYSCVNVDSERRRVWSWKMSRTNTLTAAATTSINQVVNSVDVLDARYFETVDRSDAACFYLPTPVPGTDVIFPGQCDPNVPVVTNFNTTAYLGEWRLIESYYSRFQSGTCNKAHYSDAEDGSLIVHNTHVVNQELASITGSGVLANNSRGILTVSFPNIPDSQELWILATDYTTYSLLYSCVNVDSERRRVWSWKMSRTNTLTAAATTSINQVVNSVDVLDARYFETVDRSDAACFYLPTPVPGTDVIFPGQCDPNVPVVTNFNATAYLGTWRLTESYYSRFQSGTCNTANYSPAEDGSLIVHNAQVVNQELATITGSGVLPTNDTRGIITVTFPNRPSAYDLWILATDYTSYSLLYTCVNIDSESRRVWSWIMSRTNTLTSAANTSINQVVNSVDVLDARYFETVDRSTAACFYFPTPDNSSVVVFRGQCDQNITVVANFNVTAFAGTWYHTERYDPVNNSTCVGTLFSAVSDRAYNLTEFEVVNDRLEVSTAAGEVAADGSGRLTITRPNADPTSFYILATDYSDYALAYSCENISDERRQIGVWKLSRQRTLSAAGNTAINAVLSGRQELDQRYFNEIPQSDDCEGLPSSSFLFQSSIIVVLVCAIFQLVL